MTDSSEWKFYTSALEAWDAMLADISAAQKSIDVEQYIFNHDSVGLKFIEALKERSQHGVKVRILVDEVGSLSLYRSGIATSLLIAGIEIKFFNSIVPWRPSNESLWYFRDHKKLLIIDEKIGFTGGVCLWEEMRDWRESSVRIEGPVVQQMMTSFDVMWNKMYRKFKFYFKKRNSSSTENYDFNYITNAPLPGKRYMYYELIKAISRAKSYIYLTTPYLLPDSRLFRELRKASYRGVIVKIIIPFDPKVRLVDIGSGSYFTTLLESKISIFRYKASMIHSKTGVIDGVWSTIGSLNLDNLSLRYNFEANLVSTDRNFTLELENQFLNDLNVSNELTLAEWANRGYFRRLLELLVWPIRKFL